MWTPRHRRVLTICYRALVHPIVPLAAGGNYSAVLDQCQSNKAAFTGIAQPFGMGALAPHLHDNTAGDAT